MRGPHPWAGSVTRPAETTCFEAPFPRNPRHGLPCGEAGEPTLWPSFVLQRGHGESFCRSWGFPKPLPDPSPVPLAVLAAMSPPVEFRLPPPGRVGPGPALAPRTLLRRRLSHLGASAEQGWWSRPVTNTEAAGPGPGSGRENEPSECPCEGYSVARTFSRVASCHGAAPLGRKSIRSRIRPFVPEAPSALGLSCRL